MKTNNEQKLVMTDSRKRRRHIRLHQAASEGNGAIRDLLKPFEADPAALKDFIKDQGNMEIDLYEESTEELLVRVKREDLSTQGRSYENMVAIALLFQGLNRECTDYKITRGTEAAGNFDDIVIEYKEGYTQKYKLVQVKYQGEPKEFTITDLISKSGLKLSPYY